MAGVIILVFIGLVALIILSFFKFKNKSSLQYLLFGIEITLIGYIIVSHTNAYLGGYGYCVILIGLTYSIIGFIKNK